MKELNSKPEKLQLIIVPDWVYFAHQKSTLPKAGLVDVVALNRILSERDLIFYHAINIRQLDNIHKGLRNTFMGFDLTNPDNVTLSIPNDNGVRPDPKQFFNLQLLIRNSTWNGLVDVNFPNAKAITSAFPYLMYEETTESNKEVSLETDYLFDVFQITDNVYGVRLLKRDLETGFNKQLIDCYDKVIALLCATHRFEDVAKTALFQEFVKLSSSAV